MVKGIGHAAFNAKNMDETVAFYENTMGFKRAFDIPHPRTGKPWIVYMYAGGGQFIELFYGATQDNPYKDENAGFFHMCLVVDDIQEAWKKSSRPARRRTTPRRWARIRTGSAGRTTRTASRSK